MPTGELIERSEAILGGVPVFRGTRVPVQTLIDYLAAGSSVDVLLEDFPTVRREQAVGFLELAAALALPAGLAEHRRQGPCA